jgi:hypothetical protein
MFRSPPALRSGNKVKSVLLSTDGRKKLERTLSEPSTPTGSTADRRKTMPGDKIDSEYIETCVSKYLAGHDVIDTLVNRLTEKIKEAVEVAVRTAMTAVNEELASLRGEVANLTRRLTAAETDLANRTDDLEQYQRRNNLRVFGIRETEKEDTDQLIVELCRDKLGIDLPEAALCRSHRVGRKSEPAADGKRKHRPIIVRFTSYRYRRLVFDAKKKLKGSGITVKEDLTARRLEVLQRAAAIHGQRNTWTLDGRVLWVDASGRWGAATRLTDLAPSSHN